MNKFKILLFFSLAVVMITACSEEEAPKKELIRPVKTMTVGGIKDQVGTGYPGTSKAAQETELSFKVGGPIIKYNVNPGAFVRKGALVAAIDPRDYFIRKQSAEAAFNQAKTEADRYERLWKKGSVAKNDYDKKYARAMELKAALEDAINDLNDTKLYAPFSGFYGPKLVDIGKEVQPYEPITTLSNLSVIEIVTTIPEQLAVKFKQFESFEVRFDTYPDHVFSARLKEMEKVPTPEGFKLHLYLDYKFNSRDPKQPKISAGMSCRVNINLKSEEVSDYVIPFSAQFEGQTDETPSVWIVDTGSMTVKKQHVVLGNFVGKEYVEIKKGLKSGQTIVSAGSKRLVEGQKVKILDPNQF